MATKFVPLNDRERELLIEALACHTRIPEEEKLMKKLEKAGQRIKIASARNKGMSFQKAICEDISELLGIPYDQSDDESLILSRPSGQHGSDIILKGEARRRLPVSIEAKASESLDLMGTIEQVKANMTGYQDWMILHKRKSIPDVIAIITWEHYKRLIHDKEGHTK